MMESGLFVQATCDFLLDLSNKGAIESDSDYIKFNSRKKHSHKVSSSYENSWETL